MKPAPFAYHDPRSLEDALDLLAEHAEQGKILAGGQSLLPLLNLRLAYPEHLIDINRVADLSGVRRRDGVLRIGATTRQSTLERSPLIAEGWPLLSEAIRYVAHPPIRNRGTVGGSVAHADPTAELPVAFTALGAKAHVASKRGRRVIDLADFFITHLTTALAEDELLVELEVPPLAPGTGHCFTEFARRHGDFALGGVATLVTVDPEGACSRAVIVLLGAGPTPVRAEQAEAELIGPQIDSKRAASAARLAAELVEAGEGSEVSKTYRKKLIGSLTRQAIETAAARSREESAAAIGQTPAPRES